MNSNALSLLLHLVPEDPEPLREQIARQLRDRIARGELSAGELLPDHRQLARQHRVAPSTVEAAYELLVADGLLTRAPPDEIRVAKLRPERRRDLVERLQFEEPVAQEPVAYGESWEFHLNPECTACDDPLKTIPHLAVKGKKVMRTEDAQTIEQWIRIPNAVVPVHAELVAEAFRSIGKNWETYWTGLAGEFNL